MLNQSFYVTAQRVPMLLAKLAAERLAEDAAQQMVVLPTATTTSPTCSA
ncbi:MAG: hypothetical protein ACLUW6_06665 [Coriobacteriaceae bacterium]